MSNRKTLSNPHFTQTGQLSQLSQLSMSRQSFASRHVYAITDSVDAQDLIDAAVSKVSNPMLREFLASVVQEPEVTQILKVRSNAQAHFQRFGIEYLMRSAELARHWCAWGRQESEALYVATLLKGVELSLADWVVGSATAQDVMFTIVRAALYRLEESEPKHGALLRMCLDWGNADEMNANSVAQLQQSVLRALQAVGVDGAQPEPEPEI
jgi:hypothetical protein